MSENSMFGFLFKDKKEKDQEKTKQHNKNDRKKEDFLEQEQLETFLDIMDIIDEGW